MVNQKEVKRGPIRPTTACTECQRRKQKCSREWPCNHCQTRRIAHLCKFSSKKSPKSSKSTEINARAAKNQPKNSSISIYSESSGDGNYSGVDFRSLGYLSDYPSIDSDAPRNENVSSIAPDFNRHLSPEMTNALQVIPPKPYTDILVQHFLDNSNYQYYSLYPPGFLHQYLTWWEGKDNGLPLTPEFTCLLLRVCACAVPNLDADMHQKLEAELGLSIQQLSGLYHSTARQLSSTITPGKGGLTQVQQLFLTAHWFKTQALFIESWHVLGTAIHEAQELGMHKSSTDTKVQEFDQEMRKRLWCILHAWDWQMSLLLSRPLIINSSCCSFEWPNLRLEALDSQEGCPSPITHMALQSQLGLAISRIPGVVNGTLSPEQAVPLQQEVESWFSSLPSAYRLENPDTQWDSSVTYVAMQRQMLHVIGYMVMLMPLKQSTAKDVSQENISIEKSLLPTTLECALKLIRSSREVLEFISPLNAKFHFAPFLIFDTAAFLCSMILHDTNRRLPQRDLVVQEICLALEILEQISQSAEIGTICHTILKRLSAGIFLGTGEEKFTRPMSSQNTTQASQEAQPISESLENPVPVAYFPAISSPSSIGNGPTTFPPPSLLSPHAMMNGYPSLAEISELDLGELGQIWDWGNIDLNFPSFSGSV